MTPTFCPECGAPIRARCGHRRPGPSPVTVVVVPVRLDGTLGLLAVRREIEPGRGLLALPGGFLDDGEEWAAGAARELREETDVVVDPADLVPWWFASSDPSPDHLVLYALAPELAELPPFTGNAETRERGVLTGSDGLDARFAFPPDVAAATRFFGESDVTGPSGFRTR